jgi:hypothetical protein
MDRPAPVRADVSFMTAPRITPPSAPPHARVLKPGDWLPVRTNAQTFPHTSDGQVNVFRRYELADLRATLKDTGFAIRRMGRLHALLGLAEIPREWRARRSETSGYHGHH